jgi:two-component system nitrate/nitrite response regulator NarL
MIIVLCSNNASARKRWADVLASDEIVVHETASVPGLMSMISQKGTEFAIVQDSIVTPETAMELTRMYPDNYIIVMSNQPNDDAGISYLKAGAVGYANTFTTASRLERMVKVINEGGVWVGQQLMHKIIAGKVVDKDKKNPANNLDLEKLTEREIEVANLIAQGVSNKEIADKLDITERTVKSHLNSIYNKTGVHSRLQLAILAHK